MPGPWSKILKSNSKKATAAVAKTTIKKTISKSTKTTKITATPTSMTAKPSTVPTEPKAQKVTKSGGILNSLLNFAKGLFGH